MAYKIKLEIYDGNGGLIVSNSRSLELENQTVSQLKSILNPGIHTDIKSDEFYVGEVLDLNDDDIITDHFVKYRIYLK